MLKSLIKKQLAEIGSAYTINRKTGQRRKKGAMAGYVIFLVLIALMMYGLFAFLASGLASLVNGVTDWVYYFIIVTLALIMGVIGSVFNTYTSVYNAKDNELLLSMPIKVEDILISRLLGVYLLGAAFASMVYIPGLVVYCIFAGPSVGAIVGGIISFILVTFLVLFLSAVLGWVVAAIASKTKSKSAVTVIVSLLFIAAYYYIYMKIYMNFQTVLASIVSASESAGIGAKIMYALGASSLGEVIPLVVFAVAVIVLCAITFIILKKTFLKIMTTKKTGKKIKYQEKALKTSGVVKALYSKEVGRFTKSANYMLNCGVGTIMILLLAVTAFIFGRQYAPELMAAFGISPSVLVPFMLVVVNFLSTMNTITSPSISLEGNSLWILRSLPVRVIDVFNAKLLLHIVVTGVPLLIADASLIFVFETSVADSIIIVVGSILGMLFVALLGLVANLKFPNLTWMDETTAVKQSGALALTMFGSWIIYIGMGFCAYLAFGKISAMAMSLIIVGVLMVADLAMYAYLCKGGVKRFESL